MEAVTDDELVEVVESVLGHEPGMLFEVSTVYDEMLDRKQPVEGESHFALLTAQIPSTDNGVWFYSKPHALSSPSSDCEQWFRAKQFTLRVGSVVLVNLEGAPPVKETKYSGTMWICTHAEPYGLYSIDSHYEMKGR